MAAFHISIVASGLATVVLLAAPAAQLSGDDIWQKTRAVYADLKWYEDTGVVTDEYGSSSVDKRPFLTRFSRAPRRFYLDFNPQAGGRYVIWGDPDAYHTWWKTTGAQYDFPNPNNAPALNSGRPTGSTATKIPTLLYAKAALVSDFANLTDLVNDGNETVDGRKCDRILGLARDVYAATGKEVNVRKITIWIDAESRLIRRVLEDWKAMPGTRSRVIVSYQPRANVPIDDAKFKFSPLEGHQ